MKRSPLRSVSPKRATERSARKAAVAAALARDGGCVLRGLLDGKDAPCGGQLEGHEVLTRGRGGSHLDPENIRTLCHLHHRIVTDNPEWAHTIGLVKHSWEA